jgi:hypothetical protein
MRSRSVLIATVLLTMSVPAAVQQVPHFHPVTGRNLERRTFKLPADFEGERNLILVAFKRSQQADVDTWTPFVRPLERDYPGFRIYELPTLASGFSIMRSIIDGGMRGGIPDSAVRAATITLYIDKKPFRQALNITTEDRIQAFLVDREGRVIWRTEGTFTQAAGDELVRVLQQR